MGDYYYLKYYFSPSFYESVKNYITAEELAYSLLPSLTDNRCSKEAMTNECYELYHFLIRAIIGESFQQTNQVNLPTETSTPIETRAPIESNETKVDNRIESAEGVLQPTTLTNNSSEPVSTRNVTIVSRK